MPTFEVDSRRSSRPERRHVEDLADEITELAGVLRVDVVGLQTRARTYAVAGDGYPTSSMGGGGGQVSGHSDPVGDLVARNATGTEPVRQAYTRATVQMIAAVRSLREALKLASTGKVAAPDEEELLAEGCVSHARLGVAEPEVRARGRCRWCNDHRLPDGSDPPLDKLRALEDFRAGRKGSAR